MDEFDVFVACGGDGTIQCIANELINSDKIMGILPVGSGNDFVKIFGIHLSKKDYIDILVNGIIKKYDLVQVNNESKFINTFGIGFDAMANEIASRIKVSVGRFKYFFAALWSLISVSRLEFSLKVDENSPKHYSSYLVVITNGRWEGGTFFISPDSVPTDGLLEMTISTSTNKFSLLKTLLRLILLRDLDENEIEKISFKSAEIALKKPVISHSDGEVLNPSNKYSFRVHPKAVNILSPIN